MDGSGRRRRLLKKKAFAEEGRVQLRLSRRAAGHMTGGGISPTEAALWGKTAGCRGQCGVLWKRFWKDRGGKRGHRRRRGGGWRGMGKR